VNIPQFRLFAFDSLEDRKADIVQVDVIVGRTFPSAHTPVFMANMTSVIFRPYWQVPFGIVRNEIVPHAKRDLNYLASEQLEIVPANDEVSQALPANGDNLGLLASGRLKLRQRPGPENALGLVKFSLPNSHDVYLHSTPSPALFQQPVRAFSHGCIRVSDPIALAVHVLRNTSTAWTAAAVSTAMRGEQTRHVNLTRPVPVLILYGTALATEDGKILFFNDLYGHDARLASALAHPRTAYR
jgi:L,D-transpeptidase YcbB